MTGVKSLLYLCVMYMVSWFFISLIHRHIHTHSAFNGPYASSIIYAILWSWWQAVGLFWKKQNRRLMRNGPSRRPTCFVWSWKGSLNSLIIMLVSDDDTNKKPPFPSKQWFLENLSGKLCVCSESRTGCKGIRSVWSAKESQSSLVSDQLR